MAIDIDHLVSTCAHSSYHQLMPAIIEIESSQNPWVINNNSTKQVLVLKSKEETISVARRLMSSGNNIDIGLAQINSSNLAGLNLSISQVVEPCTNLKAASTILNGFYRRAQAIFTDNNKAIFHALSAYNTGSFYLGTSYAQKVWNKAYNQALPSRLPSPYNVPIMVTWK